jgi:hypothetical protein
MATSPSSEIAGWRVKPPAGGVSILSTTPLVVDSFTDADGTAIVTHTANTGQSWTLPGGFTDKVTIQGNTARLSSGNDLGNWRMAISSDVTDDRFDIWADYKRGSANVVGDYAHLEFLAGSGSNPPQDRVYVSLERQTASTVLVRLVRTAGFSVVQTVVLDSSMALATGASIRIGATVSGLQVQVWREPAGGGTRTNEGSAVTLTADYRDGNHKRVAFNFIGAHDAGTGSPSIDNFTVKPLPTVLFLDTFTDADGTNIVAHTAETGQGYSLSGGYTDKIKIQSNTARLASGNDLGNWRMAVTSNIADDLFDIWADYKRGSADVLGDYGQLEFLAQSGANPPQDRVYIALTRESSSTVQIRLVRTKSFSIAQSVILQSGFALSTGATIRIGATVSGLSVQAWSEPAGGGTRTNIGSAVTLTADYRDGAHQRVAFNFIGAQAAGSGSPSIDNFTVQQN